MANQTGYRLQLNEKAKLKLENILCHCRLPIANANAIRADVHHVRQMLTINAIRH